MKILLVENDNIACGLQAQLLTEAGHSVTTASSGEEAIAFLQLQEWDALVTDLVLPGISGFDALAEAQELKILPLKVIITTALSKEETTELEKKGYKILYKPFHTDELLAMLVL